VPVLTQCQYSLSASTRSVPVLAQCQYSLSASTRSVPVLAQRQSTLPLAFYYLFYFKYIIFFYLILFCLYVATTGSSYYWHSAWWCFYYFTIQVPSDWGFSAFLVLFSVRGIPSALSDNYRSSRNTWPDSVFVQSAFWAMCARYTTMCARYTTGFKECVCVLFLDVVWQPVQVLSNIHRSVLYKMC
jgi:hypothetical protein